MLFFKLTCIEKIKINCNHHIRSLELHVNKKRNNPKTKAGTSGKKDLKFRPYWIKWNVRTIIMIILLLRLSFNWKMIKINILCMMFIPILFLKCPIGSRQILHKEALLPFLWKLLPISMQLLQRWMSLFCQKDGRKWYYMYKINIAQSL